MICRRINRYGSCIHSARPTLFSIYEDGNPFEGETRIGRADFYPKAPMRKTTILLLTAVAVVTCCRPYKPVDTLFRQADARMDSAPDSVLRLLEAFDPRSLPDNSSRARYALLYSRALDKNYIDLASDSVIAPAVAYFAKHGNDRDKAFTAYYLGRIRSNAGKSGEAARLMLEAEKYARRAEETYLLSMIYNCRANLFYSQYSFEEAITMYDKAESCCHAIGKTANAALMIKAKAKAYTLSRKYDEAEANLRKALFLFDSMGHRNQVAILTSGLATLALDNGRATTDSLKRLLNDTYMRYTSNTLPLLDCYLWARIYLAENKIDSARYFGNIALSNAEETSDLKCGALSLIAKIEEQAGNYRQATAYWNKSYTLFDSITQTEKRQLIQQVEERYQNQQLQHQNALLRMHNRMIFSIGALVFTIVVLTLTLILKRRHELIRRKTEEIDRYLQFIDRLQEDHSNLKNQYERLSESLNGDSAEEANLLNALENRLSNMQKLLDMAYSGECKPQAFYKAFKEQATAMNRENGAFSDLQYVVNKRYNGVIDYLRKTHPILTDSELDMLSMILFGFSFDCIRLIYNHDNVDSLYSRRTKIREKLGLPPRFRLEKFLFQLVEQLKNGSESDTALRA